MYTRSTRVRANTHTSLIFFFFVVSDICLALCAFLPTSLHTRSPHSRSLELSTIVAPSHSSPLFAHISRKTADNRRTR
ncbi:hypothetical protein B0H11DRAFT_1989677 [Mycena galericulata]|nr:hypothetical protein B0H11DRAFT_1989677 [Mycena galericulata]